MNCFRKLFLILTLALIVPMLCNAQDEDKSFNASELVMEHIRDSHEWHITGEGENAIIIPLPVIVYTNAGFKVFLSSGFAEEKDGLKFASNGLALAEKGEYAGKVLEKNESGEYIPVKLDISITKTVAVMFVNAIILILCILLPARWYKNRKPSDEAPKGFVGFVEMLVMYVVDDIIKPSIGKGYEKYVPWLLTCFLFIFVCNIMGVVPFPPGGGNVTGNITFTFFLAFCTFVITQFSGNKHYWKDIFWPEVPVWLKCPIPLIPLIEFVGIFTKPFALMIRLFANMLAGHLIALALTCIIFLMASKGVAMLTSMSILSVSLSVFMTCLELMVCFIQAMVFTMLSAIFIGMARTEPAEE